MCWPLCTPRRVCDYGDRMSGPDPTDVDALFDRLLLQPDSALRDALADSTAAGLPAIEVSPQSAQFLSLLVRISGARRLLEIGTLGGYSTICLARAAGPESSVVTLEYDPGHAEVAAANLARAGVGDRVEIIVGAALDTLPTLTGAFDFVFIDADKENNSAYVRWAIELGRPGTVIVVDNVVRAGRVLDPAAEDAQARGVRDMLEMMGTDPRLDTAAIQTVGLKGWDGFALAVLT
jgi:predicted O-methyltransferase YrrM